jgi:hypothetical protein
MIDSGSANTLLTYFNNNNPTSFPFDLNNIYQIVSIFNSGSVTTYKNGVLIGTTTNNNSTLNTVGTTNLVIGRWGWTFSNSITGNVYQPKSTTEPSQPKKSYKTTTQPKPDSDYNGRKNSIFR